MILCKLLMYHMMLCDFIVYHVIRDVSCDPVRVAKVQDDLSRQIVRDFEEAFVTAGARVSLLLIETLWIT